MAYIIKIEDKEFKGDIVKTKEGFKVLLDGKEFQIGSAHIEQDKLILIIDNKPFEIFLADNNQLIIQAETYFYEIVEEQVAKLLKAGSETFQKKETIVTAPMPGLVIEVEVKDGDNVKKGQGLLIIEAMKMQNEMKSPKDGVIKKILVQKGQTVNSKDALIVIE